MFLDLGAAPPSNAFLSQSGLSSPETYFPLKLFTCANCYLVQVEEVELHSRLFTSDYVYFSSFSKSWLAHAKSFVDRVVERLALNTRSRVLEVASNDGYLLQYVAALGIPCVGVEPTAGTANAARSKGIETIDAFFGTDTASRFVETRGPVDLLIANNVLAHVPNLNDFVAGIALVLASEGVATIEFPHLCEMISRHQFDTVYHEHFSYFSLHTARAVFARHGLRIFDVERLQTHGGSLRLWVCRESARHSETTGVGQVVAQEQALGTDSLGYYTGFQNAADKVKDEFLHFLLKQRAAGKRVVGYGAAAKGNTLLNYAGVRRDLLSYVVDASPHKQGKFLPGSRIPVVDEPRLREDRPDFVVLLPWNLQQEITTQLAYIREWGGRFVTAVPELEIS